MPEIETRLSPRLSELPADCRELPLIATRHQANPRLSELHKGDTAYIIERREVVPGTFRARVAIESATSVPAGWVTCAKDGAEFLISESAYAQVIAYEEYL